MNRVSLNMRLAQDADSTAEIYAILFEINHPSLEAPIRLSTDNTERITSDPYVLGTRSNWRGANPATEPFLWVVASTLLPSDLQDAPANGTLILENLDDRIVKVVRSFTDLATINMAVVLADTPDFIEHETTNMKIMSHDINAGEVTLSFSREEIELEYFPAGRTSRNFFPGLHL